MDAKNLLDVVDSVRLRFPDLFLVSQRTSAPLDLSQASATPSDVERLELSHDITYQNLSKMVDQTLADKCGDELYANQQQINQQTLGIYDNECMINAQLQSLSLSESANYVQPIDSLLLQSVTPIPPPKPPVAAKPANLQQKLKSSISAVPLAVVAEKSDDSLKIFEHEKDFYTNANLMKWDLKMEANFVIVIFV